MNSAKKSQYAVCSIRAWGACITPGPGHVGTTSNNDSAWPRYPRGPAWQYRVGIPTSKAAYVPETFKFFPDSDCEDLAT
eukprot:1418425-Rhodomonas_salina.1